MRDAFTPLERAALDGLAWELSAVAPDLAGQIAESLPGQRRVQGPVFLTETIVDRQRPNPPEVTHGRLGTIHVQIDHLEHPIAFQAELVNGRLIALHGDAYGQDLTRVDLTGDVVDQVFRLRDDGHPVPYDLRDRADALREASPLRRLQANPDPSDHAPRVPAPEAPTNVALDVLFGKKADAAPKQARAHSGLAAQAVFGRGLEAPPPLDPGEPTEADLATVRVGVVVLAGVLFGILVFLADLPFIFAGIVVFWTARMALQKTAVESIARGLSRRRT
jgi:hypothetical protein